MTFPAATYPYPLGGHPNGRYRQAAPQASSGAAYQSCTADVGTLSSLANSYSCPAPAIENAGVRAGEIIAYRAWVLGYDGLLHGMFMSDYKWLPGAIEHAPKVHPTWGEGLHAFKTLNEAKQQYSCYSLTDLGVVFGEVALWGEVIEHETGYRAEYASIREIIALWSGLSHRSWSFKFWKPQPLRQLRRTYSIPLDDKGTAA